ncbi:hypothetical protein A2164_02525 [Candidatus Curtissbacteria bacterium RBG_13_35_7]|uniref:Uncharacterized protein n=1 Tax=Candidatus Curtissbacteria bacterium RBG_13_35_7 TaxID=1797705 RepID=A0A1F5G2W5_9BACT|nr:MAG: hypothetical protein A2164_02525 [Candidatus Curtissbacteria bacterium RBG_13_35_7]
MAQKIIVTHISPDLDGIPAIWLLKKFHPEFKTARVEFVPAGDNTYNNEPVDSNPDVVHVDVGGGRFDHHKTTKFICAAELIYKWLVDEGYIDTNDLALKRLLDVVCEIDHGWDISKWPNPTSDRWEFCFHNIISGFKMVNPKSEQKLIEWTCEGLDAIYAILKSKVRADREIKEGEEFKTRWGKGVAIYTRNDGVMDLAIKRGYAVVVRKDPNDGYIRITGSTGHKVDLTKAYNEIVKRDKAGNWFFHISKVLLRNGSSRNPTMKPTKLTIEEVVKILERS